MLPSGPTDPYVIHSDFAGTGLTCSPSAARQIGRLAAPYLSLRTGEREPGTWRMIAGAEPPPGAVRESVTAKGETSVEHAVDHERRDFYHLAPAGEAWAVQSLLRASRAAHRSAAARQGSLFLHAGLLDLHGLGVALVGGSRAGKTTFIMAGALDGHGLMVCNDDVSLTAGESGEVHGTGWPRSVSVRLDTFDLLLGRERSAEVQSALTHPANETLPSLRESGVEKHGTALVYPWEYAELLGTDIRASARVDVIVHLGLTDEPSETGLEDVPASERGALLDRHLLDLPNKHLNIFGHEPAAGAPERTWKALAALPTYRLRYRFRDAREAVAGLAARLAPAPAVPRG